MTRPNIVYIHSHDTGRYIQPFGYAIPTPRLQGLAEEGVLFRQAFCAAPTCSPSRAALLTGCYAHQVGMTGLVNRGWDLGEHVPKHLARTLKGAGYHTVLAGFQHTVKDPEMLGFDRTIADRTEGHAAAAAFLDEKPTGSFFLDVGLWETHRHFPEPAADIDARYVKTPEALPDDEATRQDMAAYMTMARTMDEKVGVVLDALDRNGLRENTLVIATTDHGIAFPHMKCQLTDHGMGVFLIMRGPGGFDGGKVVDAMVTHLDLYPTVCDVAGIEHPDWLEGKALGPVVRGEVDALHEAVFAEVSYHSAYDPRRCVRTARWKYIRHFEPRDRWVLANCDGSLSKDFLLDRGWVDRGRDDEMLFDLVFDPGEANNLAKETRVQGVLDEMRGRLGDWMKRTGDPLLDGPVVAPAGTVLRGADEI